MQSEAWSVRWCSTAILSAAHNLCLGGSGTKLMTTLVNALKQRNKRYGLQTMCEGGGMANVTIIERL